MGSVKAIQCCAWFLGMWLLTCPALAQPVDRPSVEQPTIVNPARSPQAQDVQAVFNDLATATVVYLGETHDSAADHAAQLQIIQELHRRNPRLAIGLEMFQRPFQSAIDRYLQGEISELELRQQTQYDRRWGFPWANYAPILRYAKEHQLPVLALNTPAEVSRRVAQKGFDALSQSDRQWIPPESEIRTDSNAINDGYRQFLRPLYDDFHQMEGSSNSFEVFFLAQVLWDETMAEGVANFVRDNPDHQVVVLAGQGHIVYGYGIPSRVARRVQGVQEFGQRLLLLNPSDEMQSETEGAMQSASSGAIADYFWFSP
ncbi:ChaN family lipoprotein [Oscillatoria sp. FACHB-1407]|uniref:ChaN family lipoprotein n=1 Tax=Oscillatoria sp. FACHB-1407 TaxID=2692847 RepID=UPI001683DECE|nr:ChaN family lipoprotein [Oscillatoria sp. FACHB-1407]MBD2462847.1 ChaN family lipoprotein [Oscillatoria sp. FACHB-1407]